LTKKEPKTVTRRERVVYITNKIQKIKASTVFIHSFIPPIYRYCIHRLASLAVDCVTSPTPLCPTPPNKAGIVSCAVLTSHTQIVGDKKFVCCGSIDNSLLLYLVLVLVILSLFT